MVRISDGVALKLLCWRDAQGILAFEAIIKRAIHCRVCCVRGAALSSFAVLFIALMLLFDQTLRHRDAETVVQLVIAATVA